MLLGNVPQFEFDEADYEQRDPERREYVEGYLRQS